MVSVSLSLGSNSIFNLYTQYVESIVSARVTAFAPVATLD